MIITPISQIIETVCDQTSAVDLKHGNKILMQRHPCISRKVPT